MSVKITDEQVARALEQARALMNDSGAHWVQGQLRLTDRKTGQVSFCSVGAIYKVAKGQPVLRRRMIEALAQEVPMGPGAARYRIEWWNDRRDRSWGEVSRTFRAAARKLRAGS